ncbi:UNVERIFIED_CONTAM: hypothetical protein Slati_4396800 [Sesamum latifolium]|uniref:Uncharacterized protein n=1 Tax=Sesamum latifolium TaxID=2727402 RepID=A0AAW2SRM4_9LAMI
MEVEVEEEEHEMSSLRARRKKSSVPTIACCFSSTPHHRRRSSFDATFSSSNSIPHPSPRISPSTWIKSMTTDSDIIKGRCRNFISRMTRHRRHSSADFSYDPLSYSLNFHDDAPSSHDEFRAMNFASRLPTSPPTSRRIPKTIALFDHNLPTTPIPPPPPPPPTLLLLSKRQTTLSCRLLELIRSQCRLSECLQTGIY